MHRTAWALVLMIACTGDKDTTDDTDDTGDTDTTPTCGNSLIASFPEDGATDVYGRTVVDATLAAPDATATIVVTDSAGGDVAGTVATVGDRVVFTADAPFVAGDTYTSELLWGCDTVTATWAVDADVGGPVAVASLDSNTYLLDLRTGRFVAPTGIGGALQSLIQVDLLLQTVDNGGSLGLVTGVAAESGVQDACVPTVPFDQDADYTADPFWTASQDTLPLSVAGDVVNVGELDLSGTFSPDGSAIVGLSLAGIIDTRDLVESVAPGGGDDAVCNLFSATFGIDCEACPGGGTFCINLVIDQLTLPDAGFVMQPITESDVANNAGCPSE